ncbi:MAG: hypothetical protein WBO98_06755, partial [Candidatus Nitrotoga sp.]
MNKILNFPLDGIVNKLAYFKKVVSLIGLVFLKIKRSESTIKAGILASSLLVASPYSAAQENTQLKPQMKESGQEIPTIEQSQVIAQADTSLQVKKTTKPEASEVKAPAKTPSYYVQFRSSGLAIQTEPPRYVKQANKTWLKDIDGWENVNWLDVGVESRLRYEYNENDFRKTTDKVDEPFSLRT